MALMGVVAAYSVSPAESGGIMNGVVGGPVMVGINSSPDNRWRPLVAAGLSEDAAKAGVE